MEMAVDGETTWKPGMHTQGLSVYNCNVNAYVCQDVPGSYFLFQAQGRTLTSRGLKALTLQGEAFQILSQSFNTSFSGVFCPSSHGLGSVNFSGADPTVLGWGEG